MFVCCKCCVLSGRCLCDELITRPEESYRLWCVVVYDLEPREWGGPGPLGAVTPKANSHNYAIFNLATLLKKYNPSLNHDYPLHSAGWQDVITYCIQDGAKNHLKLAHACANPGRQVARATNFCMVPPNICGPFLCNLLHDAFLAPRILRWLLYLFWRGAEKLCTPAVRETSNAVRMFHHCVR